MPSDRASDVIHRQSDGSSCVPPWWGLISPASYSRRIVYYARRISYYTRRILYYARRPGVRLLYLPVRNVVTYTHHQNATYVTLFVAFTL